MKFVISKIAIMLCIILLCPVRVGAAQPQFETVGKIPDNLMFSVSKSCSGHAYFYQATASDTGDFAILSRYTNIEENQSLGFRLCFVDIFSADGSFLKELSFYTEQNCAIELIGESLVIYFFDKIISYDYITDEQQYLFLDKDNLLDASKFDRLEQQKFTIGQWNYTCQKGFHGYTKLTRSNGSFSEILVEFQGSTYSIWNTLVPACVFFASLLFLGKLVKRRRER